MNIVKHKLIFVLLTIAYCLLPVACFPKAFTRMYFTMGTMLEITVFDEEEQKANEAMQSAYEEVKKIDKCCSVYDEKSEAVQFNKRAAGSSFTASSLFFSLIEQSLYYSRITNGVFDITVFPLVKLWGFYEHTPPQTFPLKNSVAKYRQSTGYRNLTLDRKNHAIKKQKNVQNDFGGIAKGYALDKAAEALKTHGIKNARIDFFSTTLYIGKPENADTFIAGLAHPENKNKNLLYVHIKEGAVSVSANTELFFMHNGRKYAHIINPKTGMPVSTSLSSVMVLCKTAACADALSTALFVMDIKKGEMFLKKHPDIQAIFVSEKKHKFFVHASRALKQRLALEEGEKNNAVVSFF